MPIIEMLYKWYHYECNISFVKQNVALEAKTSCLTSHLLLQVEDDIDGLVEDKQLGLWFVIAQMQLTHAAKFFEGLIDVTHT